MGINLVLVEFKGTSGSVRLDPAVFAAAEDMPGGCILYLTTGKAIFVKSSAETATKRIMNARVAQESLSAESVVAYLPEDEDGEAKAFKPKDFLMQDEVIGKKKEELN